MTNHVVQSTLPEFCLVSRVFQEQLKEISLEDAVSLPLSETPQNEEEQKMVIQLATMVRIIGDSLKDNPKFTELVPSSPHFFTHFREFIQVAES